MKTVEGTILGITSSPVTTVMTIKRTKDLLLIGPNLKRHVKAIIIPNTLPILEKNILKITNGAEQNS